MEWDVIAPMATAAVLFLTIGGVLILRPLSERLALVEERQDFSDQLLQERDRKDRRLQAVEEDRGG